MSTVKPLTIPTKTLSQSIASDSTTFKVNNIKSWALNVLGQNINLQASDFGTRAFGCFRNSTGTVLEIFEFDVATIASANISFLKRGMSFDGDLTTQTTAYKLDWPAGSQILFGSDVPQIFKTLAQVSSGAVVPATTPLKVGDIYCDTVLGKVYISTGTSSSSDWRILN